MRAVWDSQPVVHPLALSPGCDDAGLPQIGKMPGDLRLGCTDHFREIADTYFLLGHQVEKPQAGRVTQSAKELIERALRLHAFSLAKYICLDECVGPMVR